MQYNHYGAKSRAFRDYISKFLVDNNNQFELSPVLTRDALIRMAHQNIIRRLEVRFAVPANTDIFVDPDDSTQALINIVRATNGGKITLELQSDSLERNSSLNANPVRRMIQTLLSNREQVSVLRLYGKEEEDERVLPIDLLHDRMVEVNLFNANRQNPLRAPEDQCRVAIGERPRAPIIFRGPSSPTLLPYGRSVGLLLFRAPITLGRNQNVFRTRRKKKQGALCPYHRKRT